MKNVINNYIPVTDDSENLKRNILVEIERRFQDIERHQILAISTILDPRFKKIHFTQPRAVAFAISYINTLMLIGSKNKDFNTDPNILTTQLLNIIKPKTCRNFMII